MRAINKHNAKLDTGYRRYVVALQQGRKVSKHVVSATSEKSAIDIARINHGGGMVQYARLATGADV